MAIFWDGLCPIFKDCHLMMGLPELFKNAILWRACQSYPRTPSCDGLARALQNSILQPSSRLIILTVALSFPIQFIFYCPAPGTRNVSADIVECFFFFRPLSIRQRAETKKNSKMQKFDLVNEGHNRWGKNWTTTPFECKYTTKQFSLIAREYTKYTTKQFILIAREYTKYNTKQFSLIAREYTKYNTKQFS